MYRSGFSPRIIHELESHIGAADGGLPAMAASDETAGATGVGGGVTGTVTGDDADDRRGGAGFPTALA